MVYRFTDFELDPPRRALLRAGDAVDLEPQVFDLLVMFVRSEGRAVSKDEIIEEVWQGRAISDTALTSRIKSLRQALGDAGRTQSMIRTLHRIGYQFVPDVEEVTARAPEAGASELPPASPEPCEASVPRPAPVSVPMTIRVKAERPSVAVLPFSAPGGSDDTEALAEGIGDTLVDALSAWRYFPVVSRRSTARFAGTASGAREIGAFLGARYLVTGALRRSGAVLKLKVVLIDAELDEEVWTDRLTVEADSLLDPEEELAARVSGVLNFEFQNAEARRAMRKSVDELTPWDLTMRAAWLIHRRIAAGLDEAETLAARAAEQAPDWAVPLTLVAVARFQQAMAGFSAADTSQAFAPTLEVAYRALEIDPNAWIAHALTGVGELWTNHNHERALLHVERAIELNASASMNYHFGGCVCGFAGNPQQARAYQERLFRVDPTYQHRAVIEADLGLWHLLDGELDAARARLDRAVAWNPTYGRAWQRRLALSGLTGDRDAAREAAARLSDLGLPLNTDVIAASYPFRDPAHRALFCEGLRGAGINV